MHFTNYNTHTEDSTDDIVLFPNSFHPMTKFEGSLTWILCVVFLIKSQVVRLMNGHTVQFTISGISYVLDGTEE